MLSIRHMTLGGEGYYLDLAAEDYYLKGGEPLGQWLGKGASALGLGEIVEREQLRQTALGFSPNGDPLVQNAGRLSRKPGWDHTFSAPKSVSVLWSQASPDLRKVIESCHNEAVRVSIQYLEDQATITRRGHGGVESEQGQLVVASFLHGTSREQDPQLHTHALILNAVLREDGSWGALRSRDLYMHKMAAGAVYRAALAHELRHTAGLNPRPVDRWFELAGVPKALIREFSRRRQQIQDALDALDLKGAKAAAYVAFNTRRAKGHAPRSELFAAWRKVGKAFGFTRDRVEAMVSKKNQRSAVDPVQTVQRAVKDAIDQLTLQDSYFYSRDVVRRVAECVQDGHVSPQVLQNTVAKALKDPAIVHLGRDQGHDLYSTRALMEKERTILNCAERLQDRIIPSVDQRTRDAAAKKFGLDDEQHEALRHLTDKNGALKLFTGSAGTGKTRTLKAANALWTKAGLKPIGVSVAAKAARGLESASGIKSFTVAQLLYGLDDTQAKRIKHNLSLRGLKNNISWDAVFTKNRRAIWNKPLIRNRRKSGSTPRRLTNRNILVIDEASMLGTIDFHRLLARAEKAGAKIVLTGDAKQLPSITAGSPFGALIDKHKHAKLRKNWRQPTAWHAEATRHFADGDAQTALSLYAANDRLTVRCSERESMDVLIDDWAQQHVVERDGSLVLAGTNREARLLNLLAQSKRRDLGELGRHKFLLRGSRFCTNDRIMFTKTDRRIGIDNGDAGTIERITHASNAKRCTVTVRLDRRQRRFGTDMPWKERVTFRVADFEQLALGYAATTHKAQGATVPRTFVLAGGWMTSRELAYVQMSRHREDCRIYGTVQQVGEDLAELAKPMQQSREKKFAHELRRAL